MSVIECVKIKIFVSLKCYTCIEPIAAVGGMIRTEFRTSVLDVTDSSPTPLLKSFVKSGISSFACNMVLLGSLLATRSTVHSKLILPMLDCFHSRLASLARSAA